MFKSIQYKIVLIFVLLTLSITTVIGSFTIINIVSFYNDEFSVMMEQVFDEDLIYQLKKTAQADGNPEGIEDTIRTYIGPLGIDTYRFYCILDGATGNVIYTSDEAKSRNMDITDNVITAMSGRIGNETSPNKAYMDYAVPIMEEDACKYIVYIRDTKEELQSVTQNVLAIVLQAVLVSVITAIIIGYLLSRTITAPIIKLTQKAERLAEGNFDSMEESEADDEIGKLTNTFRSMAYTLNETIDEVNSEKTKIETLLENMTDGILAFNLDGNLIHINPEAENLIKGSGDTDFNSLFKNLQADITMGDLLYIKHDKPIERQIQYNNRYIKLTFAPFSIDNKIGGVLVVLHDITKQEKLELSRREFVADVSHELRTPLATVKSYAETLMDSGVEDAELKHKFLSVIVRETDRMTRIVKDLLTLSRLDEGAEGAKNLETIDVKAFLNNIVESMFINAKKKNQTITYKIENNVPMITTESDKLEQVIVNILSNAIKYTPEGGHIKVISGALYSEIFIKIIDDGIGIPKENLSRIFERFYRVDKARSRETGGTGLGLAIAKQIIENLGGAITINSEYGKGTEVIISIPIK